MSAWQKNVQISSDDLVQLARLSERIHYTNSNEPFLNHLYVVLSTAIPSDLFAVDSYSVNPISFEQAVSMGVSDELYLEFRTHMYQHPLRDLLLFPQDYGVCTILTEATSSEFHETDIYQKFYKVLSIEDQLVFALPHPHGVYVVAYSRGTSFSKRERILMELLKPQLHIALKNWQRICDLEQCLKTLEDKSVVREQPSGRAAEVRELVVRLSPRQRAVAELVAQGLENRQIAEQLHVSPKTVGKHLENIFAALEIHHRAALASLWQQSKSANSTTRL